MLNESNIIHTFKAAFPTHIGDDAAVLDFNENNNYVISKDLLVENTHFRLNYQDAASLAHKALHVNLSDIAAMGATPTFVLLGLSMPKYFESQAELFLKAFTEACQDASVVLIGGDTTHASDNLFISVTALGIASKKQIKLRSQAGSGDLICVAGNLGHAHLGFTALETAHIHADFFEFKQKFLQPTARLREGVWFGEQAEITGMMDVSDGLYLDLKRFCEASGLAAKINLDALQSNINTDFRHACRALKLDPTTTQLTGGEDYGLMVSIPQQSYTKITREFKQTFGYDLIPIGSFHHGRDVQFLKENKLIELNLKSFSHFGEIS
ncbi:MAG: thiamine-phosphate kinase [Legionellaceae bacterium]|nr:thiamine-phosphate kinase [Legionellaceae bacterium]